MIITLKGADFSSSNIGNLHAWRISCALGYGAVYNGANYVDKGAAFNATISFDSGFELDETIGVTVTMGGQPLYTGITVVNGIVNISIEEVTGNITITVPTVMAELDVMTINIGNRITKYTTDCSEHLNTSVSTSGRFDTYDTYDSYAYDIVCNPEDECYVYVSNQCCIQTPYIALVWYDAANNKYTRFRKSESNLPRDIDTALKVHNGDKIFITATKAQARYFSVHTDAVPAQEETVQYYTVTKDSSGVIKHPGTVLDKDNGHAFTESPSYNTYEYTIPAMLSGNIYIVAEDSCTYLKLATSDYSYWIRGRVAEDDNSNTLPKASWPWQVEAGEKVYVSVQGSTTNFEFHVLNGVV